MKKKPLILIGEDDPQVRSILEQIMLGQGYDVISTQEGNSAKRGKLL